MSMKWIMLLYVLFTSICLSGQDLHFSQYWFMAPSYNPAQAGAFRGEHRFTGIYRSQWASVPVPYTTYGAAWDGMLLGGAKPADRLSAGLALLQDKAGDAALQQSKITAQLSYRKQLAKKHALSLGTAFSFAQRRYNPAALTFDRQFNGDIFDASAATGEQLMNGNSFVYGDFAVGLNWQFMINQAFRLNVGSALHHVLKPSQTFLGDRNSRLFRRVVSNLELDMDLGKRYGLQALLLFQQQGPYRAVFPGLRFKYKAIEQLGRETAISLGSFYRLGDAFVLQLGVDWQNWQLGFSYDFNTSGFNAATNSWGGPEVALSYIMAKAPEWNAKKACPIF